jgi:two-component system LytT family response regulator/two-component system response regulator LytT
MTLTALIIDDEHLAREELAYLLDQVGGVEVLAQGVNGIEAVELIEEHHPDMVFLDVQMPGLDGFAVIERLLARQATANSEVAPQVLPQVVFATAYDQYAVRAFEVNAVDYLLKPFDLIRVEQAVERVRGRLALASAGNSSGNSPGALPEPQLDALLRLLNHPQGAALIPQLAKPPSKLPSKLIVQAQNRLLLVNQTEICYAAIDEGVIRVVTQSFEGSSKCRTLEELLDLLDPALFWRAHRGFVVNINHIREVVPWFKSSYQLRMDDKKQTEIPVSRNQTRRLRELFNL